MHNNRSTDIKKLYHNHMQALEPIKQRSRYAVQGDISNNNLYRVEDGTLGMFDFNNCADNYLLCDTILQGIFLSRLMDYDEPVTEELSQQILHKFLNGYCSVRPITDDEWKIILHLTAITNAFWAIDIRWGDNSLVNICKIMEKNQQKDFFRKCKQC